MPKISVEGVTLAYEVWGQGSPVVVTGAGWFPRDEFTYLIGGRLSANHCVLLWDHRNSGASDVKIEDTPTECQLWADDLHHLLNVLNMSPAYVTGSSYSSIFALYMAHRYPQDVKGLILLDTPTDDLSLMKPLLDAHYSLLGEVAEDQGMEAVIKYSTEAWYRDISGTSNPDENDWLLNWVAVCIQRNPSNRERLLSTDPKHFAAAMKKWSQWSISPRAHLANLSGKELALITAPSLVLHGLDPVHPERTARELASSLPKAQLAQYSDRYTQNEIQQVQESDTYWTQHIFMYLPFIEEFLHKQEQG